LNRINDEKDLPLRQKVYFREIFFFLLNRKQKANIKRLHEIALVEKKDEA